MSREAFLSDPRVALGLLDGAGGLLLWPLLTSLSAAREHVLLGRSGEPRTRRTGWAWPTGWWLGGRWWRSRCDWLIAWLGFAPAGRGGGEALAELSLEQAAARLDDCSRTESGLFDTPEHRALVEKMAERLSRRAAAGSPPSRSNGRPGPGRPRQGGTRGIGGAVTEQLAAAGVVVAAAFSRERTPRTSCGTGASGLAGGSACTSRPGRPDACGRLVSDVLDRYGRLDYLVSNAGAVAEQRYGEITAGDWDRQLAVNLSAAFFLARRHWGTWSPAGSGASLMSARSPP